MSEKVISVIFFVSMLFGCNQMTQNQEDDSKDCHTKTNKEYYKDGTLKAKYKTWDGTKYGMKIKYYEGDAKISVYDWKSAFIHKRADMFYGDSGRIHEILTFFNDTLHGLYLEFYPDGKLKEKGHFFDGNRHGEWLYYTEQAKLRVKRDYVIVSDSSILNEVIYFDNKGDTIKNKSFCYTLYCTRDTISLQDTFLILVDIEAPFFKDGNFFLITGNYDESFNLQDSCTMKKWLPRNTSEVLAEKIPTQRGQDYIRGLIFSYKDTVIDNKETDLSVSQFFEVSFFVE